MATVEKKVAKKDKQQVATMKAKKQSLKKRKGCIKKKTMELSVLCDIEACVVIVDGNGEVETWPESESAVMRIITKYKNSVDADGGDNKNEYACDEGLLKDSVFDGDQNQNMVLNLYSWDDHLIDGLPLESLQEVLGMVDTKLEAVGRRIQVLNVVDDDHRHHNNNNNKGKEIVVLGEASEQNVIQTPTTFPGGELYLNQQIMETPNFGWPGDGSSFCFNDVVGSSGGIGVGVNNNQIIPLSFGGHTEQQGFFNMLSTGEQTMQTPYFFGQDSSDQILFNMEPPGMYHPSPPQFATTTGLFPGQTSFGIWQNPRGFS